MCISASVRDIVVEILFRDLEYLIDKYMTDMRKVIYVDVLLRIRVLTFLIFMSWKKPLFHDVDYSCAYLGFLSHVLG